MREGKEQMNEAEMYKELIITMLGEFTIKDITFLRQIYTIIRMHVEKRGS